MTDKQKWNAMKAELRIGQLVDGVVIRHESYGAFVDVGLGFDGLIQITDFKDAGVMSPDEYPKIGSKIRAVVLGFKERGCQIWLGVRPSQLQR